MAASLNAARSGTGGAMDQDSLNPARVQTQTRMRVCVLSFLQLRKDERCVCDRTPFVYRPRT
jgi:hypothetical protein